MIFASGAGQNLISYRSNGTDQGDDALIAGWDEIAKRPSLLQGVTGTLPNLDNYFPEGYSSTNAVSPNQEIFAIKSSSSSAAADDETQIWAACTPCGDPGPKAHHIFNLEAGDPNWEQIYLTATEAYNDTLIIPADDSTPFRFAMKMWTNAPHGGSGGDGSGGKSSSVCSTITVEGLRPNTQGAQAGMLQDLMDSGLSGLVVATDDEGRKRCSCEEAGGGMGFGMVVMQTGVTPDWRMMVKSGGELCW